jgi:hypothetical protein
MPKIFEVGETSQNAKKERINLRFTQDPQLGALSAWAWERFIATGSPPSPKTLPQEGSLKDFNHIEVRGISSAWAPETYHYHPKPRRKLHVTHIRHMRCLTPLKRSHGGLGGVDWQKSWQGEKPIRSLPHRGKQVVGTVTP